MSTEAAPAVETDAERLQAIGTALFGEAWTKRLALACGLSGSTFHHVTSGRRPLSPKARLALRKFVAAEATRVVEEAQAKAAMLVRASAWFGDPADP